jgi:hypothetical protein
MVHPLNARLKAKMNGICRDCRQFPEQLCRVYVGGNPGLESDAMRRKWNNREHRAYKAWEARFDRPYWWMLAAVIGLPICAFVLGAMK